MGFIKKYLLAFIVISTCLLLMASCTTSPTTPSAVNGEEPTTYQLGIDLLGAKSDILVDSQGRLQTKAELSSADDRVSLSLNRDTMLLNKEGEPLPAIEVAIDPSPPPPPEGAGIVEAVYDFRPEGADFNPFIMLTLSYDPEELPTGVQEGDVYIGYYQDNEWDWLRYKNVDTENHRVTTQISHFARFAVLAPLTAAERPVPTKPSPPADRVYVVYFYRTPRCYSCNYAEQMTRLTLETYFQDELDSSKVIFDTVDIGLRGNATTVTQYGAYASYTSSLYINIFKDGRDHIQPVTDIWLVVGDDEAFVEIVKSKVEASLKEIE
ncbi:MAG: hypothetical protein JSU76_03075 [Dehalococcoidia bacterium]|nr:MAG: hypothetical protein JSU76_03075 [Dehalococcoidia bacterium]